MVQPVTVPLVSAGLLAVVGRQIRAYTKNFSLLSVWVEQSGWITQLYLNSATVKLYNYITSGPKIVVNNFKI